MADKDDAMEQQIEMALTTADEGTSEKEVYFKRFIKYIISFSYYLFHIYCY